MLQFLFFGTRICLLNFHTMWALPVLALAALLVFRLFWGCLLYTSPSPRD